MSTVRLSHWTLCVVDLERSLAFYEAVVGARRTAEPGPHRLSSALGLSATGVRLVRDGQMFELLQFDDPMSPQRRPPATNDAGLSHMTGTIPSAAASIPALETMGVRVRHHTLGTFDLRPGVADEQFLFEDPDGNLIETFPATGDAWNVFGIGASDPTDDRASFSHLSHWSLGIVDPSRMLSFYRDVLDWELLDAMEWEGEGPSRVMDVGPAVLTTWLLAAEPGQRIEIIWFALPAAAPRPKSELHHLGLSHITIEVTDVDEFLRRAEAAGGTRRVGSGACLIEDPEGNLIHVLESN